LPYWWVLAFVWGSSFFLIKIALESFVPLQITFARVLFGFLAVVAVVLIQRLRLPRWGVVWGHAAFVGVMTNVIPFTLFAWAETRVSSVLAGLFNAATPLFTALFALVIVPAERLTRQRVLGLFIGFLGVMVVMGVWQGLSGDVVGSLACLGATVGYGVGVPWTRRFLAGRPEGGPSLMGAQLLCSTLIMGLACALWAPRPAQVSATSVLAVVVLGALATGLAFIWMYRVIALAGSVVSTSVTYATPVVSTFLGILVLGEALTWNQPVGAVIVLIGAALVQGLIGRRVSARRPSSA
jgi:drug/metabolite transporter (DMT)-like permease